MKALFMGLFVVMSLSLGACAHHCGHMKPSCTKCEQMGKAGKCDDCKAKCDDCKNQKDGCEVKDEPAKKP